MKKIKGSTLLYKSHILAWAFSLLMLSFIRCTPDPELKVISGNNPPADTVIQTVTKETYINKIYIVLLGRKPEQAELNQAIQGLTAQNMSVESRRSLVKKVMQDSTYAIRLYDIARGQLLNNLDTAEVSERMRVFEFELQKGGHPPLVTYGFQKELRYLTEMRAIPTELRAGKISITDVHHRCVLNSFYDEINMGSQNFVLSLFENFLHRYPTDAELAQGISMTDGKSAMLFGRVGTSKENLLDIFFASNDYYEGLVRQLYRQYLSRNPNTTESYKLTKLYREKRDYNALQMEILTSDEFSFGK